MPQSIHTPGIAISASTASANGAIPASSYRFIRVVNASTALAYCNAGSSTVVATAANIAVAPNSTAYFERFDPSADTYGAVLLPSGTGTVSMSPVGTINE